MTSPVIFEIANWKVQIENFIFPIFIFQLFYTFHGREEYCISSELLAQARASIGAERPLTRSRLCFHDVSHCNAIIFEIANWKVQIENFIFPIFIFQLFYTFHGREEYCISSELLAQARASINAGAPIGAERTCLHDVSHCNAIIFEIAN